MSTIVLSTTGAVNFPQGGGHLSVFLQYVQGFRELGCEVFWLERYHPTGDPVKDRELAGILRQRLEPFGLKDRVILYRETSEGPEYLDIAETQAHAIFSRAHLLVNFYYAIQPAVLSRFRRTVLVDIDPGLLQFWISAGQLTVPRHDLYFTTGETVGASLLIPGCGIDWLYMRPPVCLSLWPYCPDPARDAFTTISSWWGGHGKGEWVTDGGAILYENNKRVSFLQFIGLPRAANETLELALMLGDGDPAGQFSGTPCPEDITNYVSDARDRAILESFGWSVRHSTEVAGSPEQYREYVRTSRGEFSCVKPSCVKFQNAWVSDRSLCYLASGRPVIVQHTGPSSYLPNGEGMFRFHTAAEAVEAFARIRADYRRQSRTAREIAEAFFDARKCLQGILAAAPG